MSPRKRLVSLGIAVGLALVGSGPAPASLCGFDQITIFALNSVHINRDSTIAGDVVANSASPGPVLEEGAEVALDMGSTVSGNVKGHTVDLDHKSKIIGSASYVEISNQGTITGAQTIAAPPYTTAPDFQVASPGGADVVAGAGQTVVLGQAGFCSVTTTTSCITAADCPATETCERVGGTNYDDILLSGGTVVFSGGSSFDVAAISGSGSIEFDAATVLRVAGRLNLAKGSSLGPSSGSGIDASDIVIYVGGANGGAGGLLDQPVAFGVGQGSTVEANVYAPNGTIKIDRLSVITGALLGRDVRIDRQVQVTGDSAFGNKAPTADPQSLDVTSATPVTIELTGSDPEGGSLTFSIEIPGTGTLGPITEIQDPGQCSETQATVCDVDADCPGGESCVLPPVTRATVEYAASGCDTSGCPTDAFTFGVEDSCGALATAVVDVNFVPNDPGGPPNAVFADDIELETQTDSTVGITLSAGAPDNVVSLTFAVETLPSAPIETEFGVPIEAVPFDLPSPLVVYRAPSAAGVDNFSFSARDSSTGSPPCLSPVCDTGTVNIGIEEQPPLAPDLSVETGFNEPVQITLQGNPGGSGTGSGAQAAQRVSSPGYTYYYEAQLISRADNNGSPSGDSDERAISRAPAMTPVGLVPDTGWSSFTWSGGDGAIANSNFVFSGAGCLSVTDDFDKGDVFEISDNGTPIFTTTSVPALFTGSSVGPDAAYLDATYSSGSFTLGGGAHDIGIKVVVSPWNGGAAYIRLDSGSCQPNLEVTSFSAPDSAALDEPIGSQILATVTNTGSSVIPAGTEASIGYYISADAVITTGDRLLQGGREFLSQQAPGGLAIGQSVQINLFAGATISSQFPDGEPLTGDVFIGVLVDEANEVAETDEGDNTASEPIAVGNVPRVGLRYTVLSLTPPNAGILTDFSTGAPITVNQTFTIAPTLLFTPTVAFAGSTSFTYRVDEGQLFGIATVGILVLANDCLINGRPAGCTPGGGSLAESQVSQEELEREVAAGPNKGLTLVVEGVGGTASSSAVRLARDRVLLGLVCGGAECSKLLPEGAEVVLVARPDNESFEFLGWGGDCWGSDPITTVRLSQHTRCTAEFGKKDVE